MKLPIVFLAVLGLVCGKSLPTASLKDDLKELVEIVPTDKVLEIALDYLAYDKEVRELIVYIQSEEFPEIHKIVHRLMEYKHCLKFINDDGVDVYAIITEIHEKLGLPPYLPTNTTHTSVGIYGLIDDVIAVLPIHELKNFLETKLETREYVKAFFTFIHSPVFVKMVDTVRAWPEYHELLDIVREKVVDVHHIIEIFKKLYWREFHTIHDDVKEFLALVPVDKVLSITLDYLANDPELHEAFVYIQSEEIPEIHKIVEYIKEYKDCFKFVTDYGVDIHAFIHEVHYILGLPPFPTTNATHNGVGIYGLIDDVIAVLPIHDLKVFIDLKLETREYFKTVVTTIHSPIVVKMVETLQALPEYEKLLETLRKTGFDVYLIIEHLRVLLDLFHL